MNLADISFRDEPARRLRAEVIVKDIFGRNAEAVEHLDNGIRHHRRSAHEIDAALGLLVVLQIVFVQHVVHEANLVVHARRVGCGIGTIERQMELEVGELLLDGVEIFQIESLLQRTRAVPERNGTLGLLRQIGRASCRERV